MRYTQKFSTRNKTPRYFDTIQTKLANGGIGSLTDKELLFLVNIYTDRVDFMSDRLTNKRLVEYYKDKLEEALEHIDLEYVENNSTGFLKQSLRRLIKLYKPLSNNEIPEEFERLNFINDETPV